MENPVLSSRQFNKIERKLKKLQHTVYKEIGIQCSINNVNKILVIANSGLINGLSEETVFENFSTYGVIENILMIPGKSCCFIQYQDKTSAMQAFNDYNGTLKIAQNSKPIYLLYSDTIPQMHLNKMWNKFVPGLIVLENFVSIDEENTLLKLCNFDSNSSNIMRHRQVKHFGYQFKYDINNVDKDKPLSNKIPEECNFWNRLKNSKFQNFLPDQLTVNYYLPGQGIPHHIDTHSAFEDPIMSISLGSSVIMEFKKDKEHLCILLPRRSLAIMSDECRYEWTHGITPRKYDMIPTENGFTALERGTRVSFTFRKILHGACKCNFKSRCDSLVSQAIEIKNEDASQLEINHVHKVYESIASHFDNTRHKLWPNVINFIESFDYGSIMVDLGCGNGKYLGKNFKIFDIGCDISFNLVDICRKKGYESFVSSCLTLPFRDNSVDGAISIAVIHHLANKERRIQAIKEIVRILKTRGRALIYVWAKDQCKDQKKSAYLKQDRKNRKEMSSAEKNNEKVYVSESVSLPVHVNRTQFKHDDLLVPWKLKSDENPKTFLRFYHVFEENELKELCYTIDNVEILTSYYDQGNWCVIINKL